MLTQAEVGKTITVTASYTDAFGAVESKTSAATSAVGDVNDLPTGSVTITGTAIQGQILAASNTLADLDGLGVIGYQWQANGVAIGGATKNAYTLTAAELSKNITVVASYTDGGGTLESKASVPTGAVSPPVKLTIDGTLDNDLLLGDGGDNTINSLAGDDILEGDAGNDTLNGSTGNDALSGEAGNDNLKGEDGNDLLSGGASIDVLTGGAGNDLLNGGAGIDAFIFNAPLPNNVDKINDFSVLNDTIRLENQIFKALAATGVLAETKFVIGSAALEANDAIIYNSVTGALFYDADGNGAGVAVQIATLGVGLALTNADFVVI